MRRLALVVSIAALGMVPVSRAQDNAKLDVFGGYDYVRYNVTANVSGIPPKESFNGNGGGGQVEYRSNNWIGVVGDMFGFYANGGGYARGGAFSYMAGPQVSFGRGKVTPFAQTTFGGFLSTSGIGQPGPQNHFAMAAGGGFDLKVARHFAWRPLQAEYFLTKLPDGLNNRQNNLRVGTGVVFRFL